MPVRAYALVMLKCREQRGRRQVVVAGPLTNSQFPPLSKEINVLTVLVLPETYWLAIMVPFTPSICGVVVHVVNAMLPFWPSSGAHQFKVDTKILLKHDIGQG